MASSTVGSLSRQGLEVNYSDLTISPGEGGGTGPRIMFQDAMGVDQNLPASGASTSGFAIVDTGYENRRTGEPS